MYLFCLNSQEISAQLGLCWGPKDISLQQHSLGIVHVMRCRFALTLGFLVFTKHV